MKKFINWIQIIIISILFVGCFSTPTISPIDKETVKVIIENKTEFFYNVKVLQNDK